MRARPRPRFAVGRAGTAEHVDVELDVRGGLPAFSVIGRGGDLRACDGVAAVADVAAGAGLEGLIAARQDLREARAAGPGRVAGLSSLHAVAELLRSRHRGTGQPAPASER